MRVALLDRSPVAIRAGQILLAERDLAVLGLVDKNPTTGDRRIERADDVDGYDVLVSDELRDPAGVIEEALDAGIHCVLAASDPALADSYHDEFEGNGRTLVVGADLAGLASSLASHEKARSGEVLQVTIAWTTPGSQLRKGRAVAFPDPVGALWAGRAKRSTGGEAFVAPIEGDWAAASASVTSAGDGGVTTRIVGVADLADHLAAIALASAVIAIDSYASGAHTPDAAAERYLLAALDAGLDVAAHTLAA